MTLLNYSLYIIPKFLVCSQHCISNMYEKDSRDLKNTNDFLIQGRKNFASLCHPPYSWKPFNYRLQLMLHNGQHSCLFYQPVSFSLFQVLVCNTLKLTRKNLVFQILIVSVYGNIHVFLAICITNSRIVIILKLANMFHNRHC